MRKQIFSKTNSLRAALCSTMLLALILTALSMMPQAADAQGRRYSLKIKNNSLFDIYSLHMSSTDNSVWGPNLLGRYVLRSGGEFTITDIRPGEYDIKFVDEDEDECILRNVQMFENKSWVLTTEWLLRCQGYRP